jgi:ferric-chelate reductase
MFLGCRIYPWIAIGLFLFDRLVRTVRYAFNNVKPARASLISLPGDVTKVRVHSSQIKNWSPGQHVFLSLPRLGMGQSHPSTIASVPSSHGNDLVFILRAHRGFTRRLNDKAAVAESAHSPDTFLALIGGPYGASHSDFAAFDTVLLIAGSTGVTFTLPLLLDIAHRASTHKLPIRRLTFVWLVKSASWTQWIAEELQQAANALVKAGIEADIRIFVTCDPAFSDSSTTTMSRKKAGCACNKIEESCCCSDIPSLPAEKDHPAISITEERQDKCDGASSWLLEPTFTSGRPPLKSLLWELLDMAEGETGVAVCGPMGLMTSVRNTVAAVSEQRGASKGTGAEGVYLHAECFAW